MKSLIYSLFIFSLVFLYPTGCATTERKDSPRRSPSTVIPPVTPETVRSIIDKLLLFGTDEPVKWQEGREYLKRLGKPTVPEDVLALLKKTESSNPTTAQLARESLFRRGMICYLLTKFDINDLSEWDRAQEELVKMGQEAISQMVIVLATKFRTRYPKYWEWARRELVATGRPAMPTILFIIETNTEKAFMLTNEQLAQSLIEMGDISKGVIQQRIKRGDIKKRLIFIEAIGQSGNRTWQSTLEKLLRDDKDWEIRGEAAIALGKLRDKHSVPILISALNDKDNYVRRVAAEALGEIRDPQAIGPLIKLLDVKKDKELIDKVIWSLTQITRRRIGKTPAAWKNWWREQGGEMRDER